MVNIEDQYRCLMRDILENGEDKEDRTGTGTKSVEEQCGMTWQEAFLY